MVKAPENPIDPAWCSFINSKAVEKYQFPEVAYFSPIDVLIEHFGQSYGTSGGTILTGGAKGYNDARCNYCRCSKVRAYSKTTIYTGIVDDYDKRVFDAKTQAMPTLISEEQAINIALKYNNINKDDPNIDYYWASFGTVEYSNETYDYSYQVNLKYKDGNMAPTVEVRATDGTILRTVVGHNFNDIVKSGTYKY